MKFFRIKNKHKGFTLLEVLLYISLAVFIFLATSVLFSLVIETKFKQESISLVEEQGNMAVRNITQAIRNANGFNNLPAGSYSSTTLSLSAVPSDSNPTVFNLDNGVLYSTVGSGETLPLTSSQVIMSDLLFQNLGQSDATGTVRIQFKLTTAHPENGYQYSYQQIFYGSATIR